MTRSGMVPYGRVVLVLVGALLALALAGGSSAGSDATTTIVVSTTLDGADLAPGDGICKGKLLIMQKPGAGTCTLRAAIQTANASKRGTYVIQLPKGTMRLTVAGKFEDKSATGDLDLNQANLTVVGQGPAKTTIDAAGLDRVIDVPAFSFVALKNLKITGGALSGGSEPFLGGGVRVNGAIRIKNALIDSNNALQGGGVYVEDTGGAELSQVTLLHNVAGAGAGVAVDGNVAMTNVTIVGNNSSGEGGGVKVWPKGKATLTHVTISGNTDDAQHPTSVLSVSGGTLTMRNSVVSGDCQWAKGTYWPQVQHNVVTYQGCSGDKAVASEGLLPLSVVGNVVPTMALGAGSPAIDSALATYCPSVDARGVKRPQGKGCDAGAYELATS
jgi:CSLREA domain-containing protein